MYLNKTYDLCQILKENSYPGRGILLGTTEKQEAFCLYFIMGRSENSCNRIFIPESDGLRIEPFDSSKVEDPTLIVYRPIHRTAKHLVVSNGDHTDTISRFLSRGLSYEDALETRCFEPDAPHFTPRISGLYALSGSGHYTLSILKKQHGEEGRCARQHFRYCATPGIGYFIHTYEQDGSPLPSFHGEPACITLEEPMQDFARRVWQSMNPKHRISLYASTLPMNGDAGETLIINRHSAEGETK